MLILRGGPYMIGELVVLHRGSLLIMVRVLLFINYVVIVLFVVRRGERTYLHVAPLGDGFSPLKAIKRAIRTCLFSASTCLFHSSFCRLFTVFLP